MNDTSSILQDREELVGRSDKFPLDFASGSPSGIFDNLTVRLGEKQAKMVASFRELLKDTALLDSIAPDMSKSIDRQIQRLLNEIQKSPRNLYLLNNLGNIFLSIGNVDEATKYFQRALAVDRNFRLAKANLAKVYVMQDKLQDALKIYIEELEKYPDDTKLLINLAHVYLRLEQLEEAKTTIDKLISLKPEDCNGRHNLGIVYLLQGKVDRALSAFRKAVSLDVRFAPAYNALGVCYTIKGSYPKAIKYLKLAHTIDPSATHSTKNLARAYQQKGDFEAAIAVMDGYLTQHPSDWEARNSLAYSYFKIKDYKRSLLHLQYLGDSAQKPELNKNRYAQVLNNIGVIYSHTGLISEAENMFRKSLETSEQPNAVTYFNLAKFLTDLGKSKEAKELIDKYISIEPNDHTPLILLSQNHLNQGEYDKAKEILVNVLEKQPDSKDARILLSLLYAEVFDDHDSAMEIIKEALAKNKHDQILLNDLAYSYLKRGRLGEAKEILDKIDWDRAVFALYATKGLLRILEGKVAEGKRLYNLAVGHAPNTESKNLVRQKKGVEIARYCASQNRKNEARQYLHTAMSMKTMLKIYIEQASKLLTQIESLPEQGQLPLT